MLKHLSTKVLSLELYTQKKCLLIKKTELLTKTKNNSFLLREWGGLDNALRALSIKRM